jgi:hydroxypyruvate isomerase
MSDQLRKAGYDGRVGLEYKPGDRPSAEAFEWLLRPLTEVPERWETP